jgi:thiamine biosynthesis lipoprotein
MDVDALAWPAGFHRRMRPLLGTYVEIGFIPVPRKRHAVDDAFSAIEEVERKLSFHNPDSELSRLNRCGGRFLSLAPLSIRVLRLARAMTAASEGLFNCTVGGLLVRCGVLPDHGVGEPHDAGTAADIEIEGARVRLVRPVRVTLDGIAKGYAVDRAVRALRCAGVPAGWVNAGGDLRVFGALSLPVHRREADGAVKLLGGLREAAIASSRVHRGSDRRFPGAILNVRGERPAAGVSSVLARRAWRADALTKVAALAPDHSRDTLLTRLGGRLVEPTLTANR